MVGYSISASIPQLIMSQIQGLPASNSKKPALLVATPTSAPLPCAIAPMPSVTKGPELTAPASKCDLRCSHSAARAPGQPTKTTEVRTLPFPLARYRSAIMAAATSQSCHVQRRASEVQASAHVQVYTMQDFLSWHTQGSRTR